MPDVPALPGLAGLTAHVFGAGGALSRALPDYEPRAGQAEMLKRFGVLLASGLIVGESLLGILNAGAIVSSGSATPFALVPADFAQAPLIGGALFVALIALSYIWVGRQAKA